MKFTGITVAVLSTLSSIALAAPQPNWSNQKCLSPQTANQIVNKFGSLLTSFSTAAANDLLSDKDFSDTSDSINFLAGIPEGSVTFPSKQAFIGGQGAQPPIKFSVLAIDSVSCEGVIAFRWLAGVGKDFSTPVKGINILYTVNGGDNNKVGPGGWQLKSVYSEFNSAAWVNAIGGTCKAPTH